MFIPSKVHHSHCHESCRPHLPKQFGLLCWNVYKQNRTNGTFQNFIEAELSKHSIDLMLFQEAAFSDDRQCLFEGFAFDAAANLEYNQRFFGVLTACRTPSLEAKAYLSQEREAFIGTHKSLLLCRYAVEGDEILLVVNMHAINFREQRAFANESERLKTLLAEYDGPVIVAGDFNTWSRSRLVYLESIVASLGLRRVPMGKEGGVKSVFGNPLDLIFYRGLRPHDCKVLDDGNISDHNPIYVQFEIL
jgi:endonuclease/exonuclease/phosphatase (EEP) superfamily protein YafD